ncbi:putative actinidain [Helianthus annuus]|nr:putative actinidain [Helianthus annuus]KAJ0861257.1 putative actinidain [Helianthus annuus]
MIMALLLWKKSVPVVPFRGLWRISQSRDYSISKDDMKALFEEWANRCDKVYKTVEEKELRFWFFKQSFERVKKHNITGDSSFKLGLVECSDWTPDEREACKRPFRRQRPKPTTRFGGRLLTTYGNAKGLA